ncbi:succinate dehydrogenase, hydrophobic membrane anchor protein [Aliikangiella coralliicola]|uniref:Succinate dehydrogenase hydrophobic membrane anchor subunit n=1 Tax=Aliikangiella coralliicola TaxID=2592383 RepID=A0A545U4L3_9GAMM|nr:succinate dehydrogenase, hydrophobic membrane anchor protein [Aliikangiella coralliicola]TQV84420.1 succinate dehydrogenase, hydrophobic membrane anchor protein [Aliikangiella coralliicola]
MVTSATSFGRSGLHDWVIQRVTAVVLAAYVIYLAAFVFSAESLEFIVWQGLFGKLWFKIFSLLALASLCFHAWIGMWIVSTDYIKPTGIRMVFQVLVILACFAFLIWGAQIFWSV